MLEKMTRRRIYMLSLACAVALCALVTLLAYMLVLGETVLIAAMLITALGAAVLFFLLGYWLSRIDGEMQSLQASANQEKRRIQKDVLTQAYDRESTLYLMDRFLSGEGEEGVHGLMMLGINGVQAAGAQHDAAYGDAIRTSIAEKARALYRQTDILGRLNDDAFAIFLKNVNSRAQMEKQIHALLRALPPETLKESKVSIGAALYREDAKDCATLLQKAESALERAKLEGANGYALFDAAMDDVFFA